MSVQINIIENYKCFGRCLQLTNGQIEALVTIDVGPRIIGFNFVGSRNIMREDINDDSNNSGPAFDEYYYKGAAWHIYGGHRLWTSPESLPETYYPDNTPVAYTVKENGVIFTPDAQVENGIQMQIELTMSPDKAEMKVEHRVKNIGNESKEFALWALTVLTQGGLEIIPQNTVDTGLLANRALSIWPYTDTTDDRFYFGNKFISLQQNPKLERAFKIGTDNHHGYAMYVIDDTVFVNRYEPDHPNGRYPDNGMSFETYTNNFICELETLSPLKVVAPGETSEHTEHWSLVRNPGTPDRRNDEALEQFVNKILG